MFNFAKGLGKPSLFSLIKTSNIMDTQQVINLIKESFESWYNKVYSKASIVINCISNEMKLWSIERLIKVESREIQKTERNESSKGSKSFVAQNNFKSTRITR